MADNDNNTSVGFLEKCKIQSVNIKILQHAYTKIYYFNEALISIYDTTELFQTDKIYNKIYNTQICRYHLSPINPQCSILPLSKINIIQHLGHGLR